jgi:hypothetical protein
MSILPRWRQIAGLDEARFVLLSEGMVEIDEAFAQVAEAIRSRGSVPDEVIIGLEVLRGSVARWLSSEAATLYAPDHGRWIVAPSGVHLDLGRRPTLRRLMHALVEARLTHPGQSLTSAELIAAGWPSDVVVSDATANRLRVALCRLRQLGLESVLVTTSSGWMLTPRVLVVRDESVLFDPRNGVDHPDPANTLDETSSDARASGFYETSPRAPGAENAA